MLALLVGGLWAVVACAPKVNAQRTPDYDLEAAKAYAWVTEDLVLIELGEDQPNVRTKDNERLIREAVNRELAARGFQLVPKEQAQVLVAFSVGVRVRYRVEGVDPSSITATGPGEPQTKGTLNIYLIDRATEAEVWHGWTSKWLHKGDDPAAVIDEAVRKIMAAYPNDAP
ncbi:DUF4136 domain-containing protein [Paraliomyxa miuraensis]|uniref:DUF4136 domain-containing protein n=1 Tax=Paraliomyxa miuraensis TaxID=376150 RepID=UPI00224E7D4F|nr:DUF4136 domain-containing protein [Paraliomyxa miuraensis]